MQTKLKIEIPKSFFEDKNSVTPMELLEMLTSFVDKVTKMETDFNYELETEFKAMHENIELKKEIKALKEEIKRLKGGF